MNTSDFLEWYQTHRQSIALKFDDELVYLPHFWIYKLGDCPLTKYFESDIIDGIVIKEMQNKELVLEILELFINNNDNNDTRARHDLLYSDNRYHILVFDDMYLNGQMYSKDMLHNEIKYYNNKYMIDHRQAQIAKFMSETYDFDATVYKEMFPHLFGVGTIEEENKKQLTHLIEDVEGFQILRIPTILEKCFGITLNTENLIKHGIYISKGMRNVRFISKIPYKDFIINAYFKSDFPYLYKLCWELIVNEKLYELNDVVYNYTKEKYQIYLDYNKGKDDLYDINEFILFNHYMYLSYKSDYEISEDLHYEIINDIHYKMLDNNEIDSNCNCPGCIGDDYNE